MTDNRSKRIPKLEERETFEGKSLHDGAVPKQQSRWCWLLPPDGTPATVQSSSENGAVERGDSFPLHRRTSEGSFLNVETNAEERERDPFQGSWNWLLAHDGSYATADTLVKSEGMSSLDSSHECNTRDPVQGGWNWVLAPDGSYATVDTTIEGGGTSAPEVGKEHQTRDPVQGSWNWVLAPDGSYATVDTPAAEREEANKNSGRRGRRKMVHGSWFWHLAPDGTPSTVEISTATSARSTTAGKRNRGDLPAGEQLASRPRLSFQRPADFKGAEPIESDNEQSDDEYSSCDTVDGDDSDGAPRLNCFKKETHRNWEQNFQLLVEYKNKHKTTIVPTRHPIIGRWIFRQRRDYKGKRLTKYRRQRLESIGFVFDVLMTQWMEMYNQLLSYKEQHGGSTKVPCTKCDSNRFYKLGVWAYQERVTYNIKKMSEEKISLLESIGFDFQIEKWKLNMTAWMEMYHRLLEFKEKYKNTRVPQIFEADPQLGRWVDRQRNRCRDKDRIDLLNRIGFEWNQLEGVWMEMYQRLLAYQKQYKTTLVSRNLDADLKLGYWVEAQRNKCTLKHRIDLLNDIGFEWKVAGHQKK